MASPTRWTWVWVNSGSRWWTGRPGVLQSMGSQRVGHDWATELTELIFLLLCDRQLKGASWYFSHSSWISSYQIHKQITHSVFHVTKATVWLTVLICIPSVSHAPASSSQFSQLIQPPLQSCVGRFGPCHHPFANPVLHVLHFSLQQQTTFGYHFLFQLFIAVKHTIPKLGDFKQLSLSFTILWVKSSERHNRPCPSLLHLICASVGITPRSLDTSSTSAVTAQTSEDWLQPLDWGDISGSQFSLLAGLLFSSKILRLSLWSLQLISPEGYLLSLKVLNCAKVKLHELL